MIMLKKQRRKYDKAVEYFLRSKINKKPEICNYIHFALTSQDMILTLYLVLKLNY